MQSQSRRPAKNATFVPRFTARQQASFNTLDEFAAACFWRNRRAGLSHTQAMTIAVDDMLIRAEVARRPALRCSRAS
ncbi:hypothetical protein [Aureimonas glaciei]|uniref:Uncharacterized protein n=1 Tax=Aureimonas glaciei TaxID=1776957 RepID=A0A916XXZ6_9HYPH|nr:hypothetical protein [Aureimonas glaciei]GGD19873.1 hypothetical protein GCM10011335_23480 [Aureimonas glaciei]